MFNVPHTIRAAVLAGCVVVLASCSSSSTGGSSASQAPAPELSTEKPSPDPRIGLGAGLMNAEQALWNMDLLSTTPSLEPFAGVTNSDLAFMGHYAIQGNYNGFQIWDISNPANPTLRKGFFCPASQSDVSVYKNLLFVSGEGLSGRLDCGGGGVDDTVSQARLRGIRIFDISDLDHPVNVGNVQTCRGSHTHSLLVDPDDPENVYVYVSGSAGVRSSSELAGCSEEYPDEDPNSSLFRIEVIKVPLAHPEDAEIVSSPRIFEDLEPAPEHGPTEAEAAARAERIAKVKETGEGFIITIEGEEEVLSPRFANFLLDSLVKARGGSGAPTGADSAALREELPGIIAMILGSEEERPPTGPTQCHDITLYPAVGLAGGACGGYGLVLDISDPVNPKRIEAVADSNFSYWHSATFNNAGTMLLFSDEWGGGGGAKCRATDPMEWGGDAIFTIENGGQLDFQSYYKLPVVQTAQENCVAHNGSLIPIPGRNVMVQGWYQGGVSVFDWTDPANPIEIAFFDRGPVDSTEMASGGVWSVYWYNGNIVSSEISRGLDILQLEPSGYITQNEIDAARTVHFDYWNVQGQQMFDWPPTFALARAYLDQLARNNELSAGLILDARQTLAVAEGASGEDRSKMLNEVASELKSAAAGSGNPEKVKKVAEVVTKLAGAGK